MTATPERRFTITITPMSEGELALLIADLRARWGRKHLVHVIGDQPSGTHLDDAPRPDAVDDGAK